MTTINIKVQNKTIRNHRNNKKNCKELNIQKKHSIGIKNTIKITPMIKSSNKRNRSDSIISDAGELENEYSHTKKDERGDLLLHIQDHTHNNDQINSQWDDRMLKSRERNREHAKKTRLRKKVGIDGMKQRLLDLQNEVCIFKHSTISLLYTLTSYICLYLCLYIYLCRHHIYKSSSKKAIQLIYYYI